MLEYHSAVDKQHTFPSLNLFLPLALVSHHKVTSRPPLTPLGITDRFDRAVKHLQFVNVHVSGLGTHLQIASAHDQMYCTIRAP